MFGLSVIVRVMIGASISREVRLLRCAVYQSLYPIGRQYDGVVVQKKKTVSFDVLYCAVVCLCESQILTRLHSTS